MAAHTISRLWSDRAIDRHRGSMVMAMAAEVGNMTLGAGTAGSSIDGRITMAVDPNPAATVDWIMARVTGGMHCGDDVAGMAVDTERGCRHGCRMVVGVVVEIEGVAAGAACTPQDGSDCGPLGRVLQCRRRGVAIAATTVVDCHRIIGRVAESHTGRGI